MTRIDGGGFVLGDRRLEYDWWIETGVLQQRIHMAIRLEKERR